MTLGVECASTVWDGDHASVSCDTDATIAGVRTTNVPGPEPIPCFSQAQSFLTRIFDITTAVLALLAALPALFLLAVALQIDSPGPLFFVQRRIGRNGKTFPCLKFRTMCVDADRMLARHLDACSEARGEWARDFKLRSDPRITRLGGIVRRFSLDEFPQLLNIIVGHMSVVGPRPIVHGEIERYGRFFPHYCAVRPGLTGLWQISGRNDTTYSERVAIDCRYVATKTLLGDVAIAFKTVPVVLNAKGSY